MERAGVSFQLATPRRRPTDSQAFGRPQAHPHLSTPPRAPIGRVAEGVAAYERALALQPRHAEALYNLGVACSELGQLDRALFMCAAAAAAAADAAAALIPLLLLPLLLLLLLSGLPGTCVAWPHPLPHPLNSPPLHLLPAHPPAAGITPPCWCSPTARKPTTTWVRQGKRMRGGLPVALERLRG